MKVSVMITTRNRREELCRTLQKLSDLRPPADEILICADGCTDGTSQMVKTQFPNCRLLENEASRGSVFSRDRLLRSAQGDIVVSLDDDSYPTNLDFFHRVKTLFTDCPEAAVFSFPEIRDDGSNASVREAPGSSPHAVPSYASCAAVMRREVYLHAPGFPFFFQHMYEEPDYALQCYSLGYWVFFEPTLSIRHHVSASQRDLIGRHHLNARNELWSVWLRCPFPQLMIVGAFRVLRQFMFAASQGWLWCVQEPRWWWDALSGLKRCLSHRQAVSWGTYYSWMCLARKFVVSRKELAAAFSPIKKTGECA